MDILKYMIVVQMIIKQNIFIKRLMIVLKKLKNI
jgi:hypothetical protein